MTSLHQFSCHDLFKFNSVNLDPLTETYNLSFYLGYLAQWPDYFQVARHAHGSMMGYIMGKAEGVDREWHGHVTALTVAPGFRRLGLARRLMTILEHITDRIYKGYFVDLYVRASNQVAIGMYEGFGYTVYRRVLNYYTGDEEEDALDMRKSMSRDPERLSMIPLKRPVDASEIY